MPLRGINHLVLKVRSLTAADRFYRGVLGLERVGERPGMWFYRAGGHHHDLALLEVGAGAAAPDRHAVGLFHFCLDVGDEASLADLYGRCRAAGVEVMGTADHNVMKSFYVRDPDGHVVELGFDTPPAEWEGEPFARDRAYRVPVNEI